MKPRFYAIAYVLLVGFVLLLAEMVPSDQPIAATMHIPSDETQVDLLLTVFASMFDLVTGLNTVMLAGAAAMAVKGREWSNVWTAADAAILTAVFVCGAVSYYGVYLAYVSMLEMIEAEGFTALAPGLDWGFRLQFFAMLLGFFLLGLVFCRLLAGRRTDVDGDQTGGPRTGARRKA